MRFQERQRTSNHFDQQGSHMKATIRHLGYSRLSGPEPGHVVVVTSSFLDSTVSAVHTRKQRFQTVPFSNHFTLESVFGLIRFR